MLLTETGYQKRMTNAMAKKKIMTTNDLVRWAPRKYRSYLRVDEIYNCVPDEYRAVRGILRRVERKEGSRKYLLLKVEPTASDSVESGRYFSVMFFSRLFLANTLYSMIGQNVIIGGKVSWSDTFGYSISEPDFVCPEADFEPFIKTIYSKVGGVSDKALQEAIEEQVERTNEPLEWEIMSRYPLTDYKSALEKVHFPKTMEDITIGSRRLRFNDMLYFALGLMISQRKVSGETKIKLPKTTALNMMLKKLPFELTEDQKKVIAEFHETAKKGERINTLLQGDVGSGKTIVAMALMLMAYDNGYQSVLMAPREVLAKQHYESVKEMAEPLGIRVAFLHSGMKAAERRSLLKGIADGSVHMIIGTHSCLGEGVDYAGLGVVVTDEEHLFGVKHKEEIIAKAEKGVHVLSMSATPIPRTIATVMYGESKRIAILKSMPKGRLPVKTAAITEREKVFPFMLQQIEEGRQCYVVCPAIEDTEDYDIISIESVEEEYRKFFEPRGYKVEVVNGKMDREDAEKAVDSFVRNEAKVLISTTVIEVGVNVPNASVIVIEQAERFGLASLHQLRGRVGRGQHQSYCILRTEEKTNPRIETICSTADGFVIAEEDIKLRGSGNLLGVEQAGANKYVEMMLQYPNTFQTAKEVAAFCLERGLGERLMRLYEEHDEALGELKV